MNYKVLDEPEATDYGSHILARKSNGDEIEFLPYSQDGSPHLSRIGIFSIGKTEPVVGTPRSAFMSNSDGQVASRHTYVNSVGYQGFISVSVNMSVLGDYFSNPVVPPQVKDWITFNCHQMRRANDFHSEPTESAKDKLSLLLLRVLRETNYPWYVQGSEVSSVKDRIGKDREQIRRGVAGIIERTSSDVLSSIPMKEDRLFEYLVQNKNRVLEYITECFEEEYLNMLTAFRENGVIAGRTVDRRPSSLSIRQFIEAELESFRKG